MGLKIHEYPNEASFIQDEDFYDVDYYNPLTSTYESHKISGLTLKEKQAEASSQMLTNTALVQYGKKMLSGFSLPTLQQKNICPLFDNTNLNAVSGYYDMQMQYGITLTLSGTSGTANININGTNYLVTWNATLKATSANFASTYFNTLSSIGVRVFGGFDGSTDGRIRFGSTDNSILDTITITNVSGDLNGTIANEFTGLTNSALDHFIFPYVNTPVENQVLLSTIQTICNIDQGSVHYAEMRIVNYGNDTYLGGSCQLVRNSHTPGQMSQFEVYSNNGADAKIKNGFYLQINNTSNTTLTFIDEISILIKMYFQRPTIF